MSNVTTPTVVIDDFASLRIALIFIGILLTLATIYVFTALVTHRVRTAKRKKRELLQQQQDGSRRSFKRKGQRQYVEIRFANFQSVKASSQHRLYV